ncbi:MAG TPA: UbiA family prenyltransferase [Vitreimonas sp.]|nr:UbiA family prenyltransferase [Vitreimonas sp.]
MHPFPIVVDAGATFAIAIVAGADPGTAVRLAGGMLALQAAIGALNDVVDAPRDAGRKPGKPIPAGLVSTRAAGAVCLAAALVGLLLSLPSGLPTVGVAVAILCIGAIYDLRLKGTPWSWVPFASGIPLLPVYAWLGAVGSLPALFVVLLPAAFAAGAALAIANALADVERDEAAGVTSIAAHLGQWRAWRVHMALHGAVLGTAAASLAIQGVPGSMVGLGVGLPAIPIGVGCWLAAHQSPSWRERAWELEAIGIAVLAGTWLVLGLTR